MEASALLFDTDLHGCGMCCAGHYSAAAAHRQRRVRPWGRCCGPVDRSPEKNGTSVVDKQKCDVTLFPSSRGNGQCPAHPGSGGQHSPSPRQQGRICTGSASAPPKPASCSRRSYPPKCGKARLQHKWLKGERSRSCSVMHEYAVCVCFNRRGFPKRRAQKSI